MLHYVVVTPARNESRHMRALIESMVAQSRLPLRWVIVSDASTDGTDDIVESYRGRFDWIDLVRMPEKRDRSFAAKASCVNAGLERVAQLPYDIIASLDADITFPPDYFAYLLERFEQVPRLGVAGTCSSKAAADVTTITSPISNTSREPARCSGVSVSRRSAATSRSEAAGSTGSPCRRLA